MYGLRTAAKDWEKEVKRVMVDVLGFQRGTSSPCLFWHKERDLRVSVHGDDFSVLGTEKEGRKFYQDLCAHWTVKSRGMLGADCTEIDVLNRILTIHDDGSITLEADPRHVPLLLRSLGLEESSKTLVAPMARETEEEVFKAVGECVPLVGADITKYRSATMRAAYLAQDRFDVQFTVKELAKEMHHPTTWSVHKLKHLARYLIGRPRAVLTFVPQRSAGQLVCEVDADYAGDKVSRKSTSGGVVFYGKHILKSWASNQAVIALSTGESELYAAVKGFSVVLGCQAMFADFGLRVNTSVGTDSSAAKSLIERNGLGKAKHICTSFLWVQEALESKRIGSLFKVKGENNRADLFTKALTRGRIDELLDRMSLSFPVGQSKLALRV